MQETPLPHPLGDSAITITFGNERSAALLSRIHATVRHLRVSGIPDVKDIVPAYLTVTVFYDALRTTYQEMAVRLIEACRLIPEASARDENRQHGIPVRYDGIDLQLVATATGLSVEEVILRHSARTYTVDLLGFVPGFAYLSELDPKLQLPRRPQPRPRVAVGSVAVAAAQTGIYPLDTPGGWHIIGTTDRLMFDPVRDRPALLAAGDRVRFERVR